MCGTCLQNIYDEIHPPVNTPFKLWLLITQIDATMQTSWKRFYYGSHEHETLNVHVQCNGNIKLFYRNFSLFLLRKSDLTKKKTTNYLQFIMRHFCLMCSCPKMILTLQIWWNVSFAYENVSFSVCFYFTLLHSTH